MTPWLADLPALAQLQPEDQAWAVNWLRHASGDWGGQVGNLLAGLQRTRARRPLAFQWLALHSNRAAQLAAKAGWNDPSHHAPSPDEIAAVAQTLAALQPHDAIRSPSEQIDAITGLPLRHSNISPQTLAKIRENSRP